MSRNKERLGNVQQRDTGPPPTTSQSEGFSFVLPTEFVELPSGGRYYHEEHPLYDVDEIEIKQMTAKEEDMLTSRTLLKKGVALDRVISSLIVDKRIDSDTLLVGDRNAVIIAARVSAYGNEYTTKVTCPQCAEQQRYSFDLNSARVFAGDDASELKVVSNSDGTFGLELPRTKLNITFRLLTGKDEKRFISNINKKQKTEKNITNQLSAIISAVNGVSDKQTIDYVVINMPSMDSRHLRSAYRLVAPNIDLSQNFECEECGFEQDMEVPLSADFFWPDR